MKRFGFKSNKKATGLASIGAGTPNTNIYIGSPSKDVKVGIIIFNDGYNRDYTKGITVQFKFTKSDPANSDNPNCAWYWYKLTEEFSSAQEAKDYINQDSVRKELTPNIYTL